MRRGRNYGYLFFVRYWPAWSEGSPVVHHCDDLHQARTFALALRDRGVKAKLERLQVTPLGNGKVNVIATRLH